MNKLTAFRLAKILSKLYKSIKSENGLSVAQDTEGPYIQLDSAMNVAEIEPPEVLSRTNEAKFPYEVVVRVDDVRFLAVCDEKELHEAGLEIPEEKQNG